MSDSAGSATVQPLATQDRGLWVPLITVLDRGASEGDLGLILLALIFARALLRGLGTSKERVSALDAVFLPALKSSTVRESAGYRNRWNLTIPDSALFDEDANALRDLYRSVFGALGREEEEKATAPLTEFALRAAPDADTSVDVETDTHTDETRAQPDLSKGAVDAGDHVRIKIWYGTTRAPSGESNSNDYYSGERALESALHFGTCDVSIPWSHEYGQLERPKWWRLEFRENPAKHVVLREVNPLSDEDSFVKSVREQGGDSAFVFIHGYNVSFAAAARQVGQLTYDLKFRGVPCLFSWPARGGFAAYPSDEASAEASVAALGDFLEAVTHRCDLRRVHLLAHSMGARCLARAAASVAKRLLWRQLVLTAPDIDQDELRGLMPKIVRAANRTTLYASSNDLALIASRTFHSAPRAGESGVHLLILPAVDTVDVSRVDTSLLGHSYHAVEASVVSDLTTVLNLELPPTRRPRIQRLTNKKGEFWRFV
jgi:esterase/lipase superfamily enzyme